MGTDVDKLCLDLAGRPGIAHTWANFERTPEVDDIIVVVRDGTSDAVMELATEQGFRKPHHFVFGGQ